MAARMADVSKTSMLKKRVMDGSTNSANDRCLSIEHEPILVHRLSTAMSEKLLNVVKLMH